MSGVNSAQARQIAVEFICAFQDEIGEALSIIDQQTIEFDRGWIFFYETIKFLETGDDLARLAGNGPVFVNRAGESFVLPSSIPWQQSVDTVEPDQ